MKIRNLIFGGFLSLLLIIAPNQAKAGIFIEPIVGYQLGWQETTKTVSGVSATLDMTTIGPNFGARAGYMLPIINLMGGASYRMGSGLVNDLAAAAALGVSATETTQDSSAYGVFVGYEFPIALRAWVTYELNVTLENMDGSDKGKKYTGSGQTFGVGLTMLPFININFEYRMITFDEETSASGTLSTLTGDEQITSSEVFVSLSLPLP